MQLYNYFRSSAAFRVRIALNYKSLAYSTIDIDLRNNEQRNSKYLSLNTSGLVPTLKDNNKSFTQSLAIMEYLEEQYPAPHLLPDEISARAYVRQIALTIACDIHPLNNLRVLNYITKKLNQEQEEKLEWYRHWVDIGLSTLEDMINQQQYYTGSYCYKDMFSMADMCLVPQLYNAKRFNCSLNNYPTLMAIEEKCLKLDAVRLAYPNE